MTAPASGKVIVGGVQLPTYAPFTGVTPDSPGSPDGMIDAGFKTYPATRSKSVTTPPGDGSDINIMTYTSGAVPPAVDSNPGWQEVNRQVNANLKVNMTPFADYFGTKLQVTIAGGELPDLFFIIADPGITLVPEFFDAKVADLTPYLSGDAVKDYPNLAAIPTRSWKTTVYDAKIYGVPVPLRPYFWWYWVHQELLDQANLKQPTNADEMKQHLTQFTQPNSGLWGIGVEAGPIYAYGLWMGLFTSIFGAPNNWAVDPAPASSRRPSKPTSTRPPRSTCETCIRPASSIRTPATTTPSARATPSRPASSSTAMTAWRCTAGANRRSSCRRRPTSSW